MKTIVDRDTWCRKEYYDFFAGNHPMPNGGMTVMLDVDHAFRRAKESQVSFFLYYLHCSLRAANELENYRFRIENEGIVLYDRIRAGFTVARDDHSFAFASVSYCDDFEEFAFLARQEMERCKQASGLALSYEGNDVFHYTVVPNIHFTSLQFTPSTRSDIPKFAFGQMKEGKMPHAMQYHHGFIDGYHVGQYLKRFQELLNQ